jgi:hypothetical protein
MGSYDHKTCLLPRIIINDKVYMFEECHIQNYLHSSEMYFHFELTFIHNSAHLTETPFQIYEMTNESKGFASPESDRTLVISK